MAPPARRTTTRHPPRSGATIVAQTTAKVLTSSSEATTSGASFAIGETATYTLTVTVPEGSTPNLTVLDNLPVGMDYFAGSAVVDSSSFNGTLPVPVITAPGGSGADVTLTFGAVTVVADNVTTNDSFTVTLQARVLNIAGNQAGTSLNNNSSATIGAVTANAAQVNAAVVEPVLGSSLVPSTTTPGFASPVTYTYTLTQTGGSNANEVVVTVDDPLDDRVHAGIGDCPGRLGHRRDGPARNAAVHCRDGHDCHALVGVLVGRRDAGCRRNVDRRHEPDFCRDHVHQPCRHRRRRANRRRRRQ